ncbi:hypothetical protein UFOVP299_4 [uncultured Caudovirales phage]|uniref:Uncharacterized protein n=1 Tax=uncultured Caudovirales phage TaxID=2100421 RepID=A0A6J5LWE0_9CAUD|nr:hypothetical protein UFOVP299_4 [uncultured Caudovirales phage]
MAFKHYLNFLSLPSVSTIEIAEPIGFDGASYKVKQDDKRFGRDIIIANEDTELTFTRDYFEQIQITQILPSGEMFNYASQGFDYLLDIFQNDGWEGKVEYIIEKDEVSFTTGIFSYYTSIVEFDNIKVKIIQNTNREVLKRLEDTDIDAFNSLALDGREIEPCETTNILLKAKPIIQESNFSAPLGDITYSQCIDVSNSFLASFWFNSIRQITKSEILNTYTNFELSSQRNSNGTAWIPSLDNFRIIKAINKLNDINIEVKLNFKTEIFNEQGFSTISRVDGYIVKGAFGTTFLDNCYFPSTGSGIEANTFKFYESGLVGTGTSPSGQPVTQSSSVDSIFNVNVGNLDVGGQIWFVFLCTSNSRFAICKNTQINSSFSITATSTYVDTVVKGIRLIDLIKHNVQSIVEMPVEAPEYDVNGEHYDNFAFNGLLLGQITDKPFYNKFKDLMNIPLETCSDYQINPNFLQIFPYAGFYEDIELAVFDELPSFTSNSMFSKQYTLKNAEFKYSRSSSERETNRKNSIDDVHTETQKYITDSVDGSLKVDIKHIRSAFLIEQARQRAFENQETTSLQNDDNLFLLKCVTLAPGSEGTFSSVLLQQINPTNNNLQILNNNEDGDGIDFNWTLLGFSVGDTFFIDEGQNNGEYTVISITSTILELDKNTGVPPFAGEGFVKLRWFYTDVDFTNQTNEDYALIEGVANPDRYSNLDYSWGRNIQRWYPYLASATKFKPNDVIKTSSFRINGNLVTRKNSETENISDSANILNSDIASLKILNPFNHTVKVYAPFNIVTQLIEDIRDVKGYVSVNLNDGRMIKGYIQNMDYTWITEELDLVLEEKFISDFMEIDLTVNLDTTTTTTITNPNYPTKTDLKSFQINNIFVTLYDSVDNTLYPPTRFTNVKINGVQYTDITLFSDALTLLINSQNE